MVGVCAFSGSLRGLELVPSKWRYLVPPTSPHQGANATGTPYPRKRAFGKHAGQAASRWAALAGSEFSLFLSDKKGVTQQELAENIGMSVVAIAYIESGKRWARLGTLNKIANSLKVSVADLFKGI